MNPELKEAAVHGSSDYPFAYYDLQHIRSSFHVSLHWHEEVEIIYVYEGPLYLTINNETFIGKAGDIFLVNSKEIHGMDVKQPRVRYGTLLFSPNSFLFLEGDYVTREYLHPLCRDVIFFSHTIESEVLRQKLFSLITEIIRLNEEKVPAYQLGTKALLLQFLFLLFENHLEKSAAPVQKNSALNREILTLIHERYTQNLTLKEIADTFHMSYKYFSRYFKNTFHTTLSEYIMKLRLEKAQSLLSTTEISITEISLQTGFNNISFFIRSFKKAYGLSPLQYRQKQFTSVQKES